MSDYRPSIFDRVRGWFITDEVRDEIVWWSDKIRAVADPDATTVPLAVIPAPGAQLEKDPVPTIPRALWDNITAHRVKVEGPDVSKHQGRVDWEVIARHGASFAFCKASEGYGYRDPQFNSNWRGMQRVGLVRGAYHFARVNIKRPKDSPAGRLTQVRADAVQEARWFCDVVYSNDVDPQPGDLPLALDIEWDKRSNATATEVVAFCVEFTNIVEARTGRKPIVYTGPSFWKYKMEKSLALSDTHLWLVSGYKNEPGRPTRIIEGWDWVFDQYSNKYPRPDRTGRMDWNYFRGTVRDLADLSGVPRDAIPSDV